MTERGGMSFPNPLARAVFSVLLLLLPSAVLPLTIVVQLPDFSKREPLLSLREHGSSALYVEPSTLRVLLATKLSSTFRVVPQACGDDAEAAASCVALWATDVGAYVTIAADGASWEALKIIPTPATALTLRDSVGGDGVVVCTAAAPPQCMVVARRGGGVGVAPPSSATAWEWVPRHSNPTPPARQAEYWTAMRRNIANPDVSSVHVLWERGVGAAFEAMAPDSEGKVRHFTNKGRLKYSTAVLHANRNLAGQIAVLLNADIALGEGIAALELDARLPKNRVLAPVRHELDECRASIPVDMQCDCRDHQLGGSARCHDTYVFRPPLRLNLSAVDFYMGGLWGAEHLWISELRDANVDVTSPCGVIVTHHIHCSSLRPNQQGLLDLSEIEESQRSVKQANASSATPMARHFEAQAAANADRCFASQCMTASITRSVGDLDPIGDDCTAASKCDALRSDALSWDAAFVVRLRPEMQPLRAMVHVYNAREQILAAARRFCHAERIFFATDCAERLTAEALRTRPRALRVEVPIEIAPRGDAARRFAVFVHVLDAGAPSLAALCANFCSTEAPTLGEEECAVPLMSAVKKHLLIPMLSVVVNGEEMCQQLGQADFASFCTGMFANAEERRDCLQRLDDEASITLATTVVF